MGIAGIRLMCAKPAAIEEMLEMFICIGASTKGMRIKALVAQSTGEFSVMCVPESYVIIEVLTTRIFPFTSVVRAFILCIGGVCP